MKTKISTLLLASATVFMSCDNEMSQIAEFENEKNAIAFSTYSMMSKGSPINGNGNFTVEGSSFNVTAFLEGTTSEYMSAKIVYKNGWVYANSLDKTYWPTNPNSKLTFFSVSPSADFESPKTNAIAFGADSTKVSYTIPTNTTDQQDLMFASTGYISNTNNGKVTLQFKHALNQIHFKAKTDSKNIHVDIDDNGIQMCNILGNGDLNFNSASNSWDTNNSTKVTYTAINEGKTINTINEFDDAEPITGGDVLMLMPQSITPWIPNPADSEHKATTQNNSYLKINCKLYTIVGTEKVWYNGSDTKFAPIYIPFTGNSMELFGKKITYTLIFGGGYNDNGDPILSPITFETKVDEWDEL